MAAGPDAGPLRTGSVILTVFGDAIVPRGGAVALPGLMRLMRHLGAADTAVRTALSRLLADGWLARSRVGTTSVYSLGERGAAEFAAAAPRIYGPLSRPWDGQVRLVVAEAETDREDLDRAGYAAVAPGVYAAPHDMPFPGAINLLAAGDPAALRRLAERTWMLDGLGVAYVGFAARFEHMAGEQNELEALGARVSLIHAWRRIVLRDPRLPDALLPPDWPGGAARRVCVAAYVSLAEASENALDTMANGSGPLPRGPDPRMRFSAGCS